MRRTFVASIGLALALLAAPAHAEIWSVYGINGNDTGGIIPWTPENERDSFAIASRKCAWWNKYPVATSISRVPGDYISYKCVWTPPAPAVTARHQRRDLKIDK